MTGYPGRTYFYVHGCMHAYPYTLRLYAQHAHLVPVGDRSAKAIMFIDRSPSDINGLCYYIVPIDQDNKFLNTVADRRLLVFLLYLYLRAHPVRAGALAKKHHGRQDEKPTPPKKPILQLKIILKLAGTGIILSNKIWYISSYFYGIPTSLQPKDTLFFAFL